MSFKEANDAIGSEHSNFSKIRIIYKCVLCVMLNQYLPIF